MDQCNGELRYCFRSDISAHPGNNAYLSKYLEEALQLGLKLIRCPRNGGLSNPDIDESYFVQQDAASSRARNEVYAKIGRSIEARGCGIHHIKEIAKKYTEPNEHWTKGLKVAPSSEDKAIAKAIAEWADGDSMAAHIAYGLDYFCTRDFGKSGGSKSILSQANREWLKTTYAVQFTIPEELAVIIG
ncbi:MAG: hypothetical protein ACOYL3_10110 [Desulfuromonadaceae bacterium]